MKNRLPLLISLTVLLAFALSACQASKASPSPASAAAPANAAAPASAAAPGIVQARIEPHAYVDLAFGVPGRVAEVLVNQGDLLSVGQPIARLEGSEQRQAELARAGQELLASEQSLLSAQKDLDDLNTSAALNLANADLGVVNAQKVYDDAVKNRKLKDFKRCSQDNIDLYYKILDDAQARLKNLQDNPESRSVTDLRKITAAQSEVDTAQANYLFCIRYTDNELAQSAADISVAQATLNQAKARQALLKQSSGVDPVVIARLTSAVSAAQSRLASAKTAQVTAQSALDALELRAPMAGTLTSLDLKLGQFVQAGLTVANLADFSTWVALTDDLTELEVVKLKSGDAASLTLDALPGQKISGKVVNIASRYIEKRGDTTYTVTLVLDPPPADVRWGMTGQISFVEGK
jgi:multidrug resistance efflux pump